MTEDNTHGFNPALLIFVGMGLFGMIAAVLMFLSAEQPDSTPADDSAAQVATPADSPIGKIAPNFELTALNGELVSLAQYRGRPVFINLWWTGCPPCVREFPAFQQFIAEQGDTGAVVIAVNQGDSAGDVRQFVQDLGVTDVVILLDPDMRLPESYPNRGLFPTTYLIDEEGVVRERKIGEISLETLYIYLDAIADDTGAS